MKIVSSDGSATSKRVTRRATGDGCRDDRRRVGAGRQLELGEAGTRAGRTGHPAGRPARPAATRPSTPRRTVRAPARSLHLAERARGDHPSVVDDGERLAQGLGRLHLVGREDDRAALVAQLEEGLAQEARLTGSSPVNGSSISSTSGSMEDGRDELDLLLVALAQLLGPPLGVIRDAEAARASGAHPRERWSAGWPYRLAK